jgi:hypothetical protein
MPGSNEGGQLVPTFWFGPALKVPSPAAETATSPTSGRGDKPVVWIDAAYGFVKSLSGLLTRSLSGWYWPSPAW